VDEDDQPTKKGRGHPPKEYQWPKGVSGNPFGRPLGSRNRKKAAGRTFAERLALEEAERAVTTSDGEMSALRAVLRSQHVHAIKGGSNAQRDAINRALKLDQEQDREQLATLHKFEEYKRACDEHKVLNAERFSKIETLLLPHPDDIEVDFIARSVRVFGPLNTKERKLWDEGLAALVALRDMALDYRRKVAANPDDAELHWVLLRCTNMFMRNNDKLPQRYRLKPLPIWKKGKSLPFPGLQNEAA
jgi:hypothetical protein